MLAAEPRDVDLDADLEQEQHDADVGEQHELLVVRDVAGRERRDEHADREVADDRREPQTARRETRQGRHEQQQPELEDRQRRRFHGCIVRGRERSTRHNRTPRHGLPCEERGAYSPRVRPFARLEAPFSTRKEGQRKTTSRGSRTTLRCAPWERRAGRQSDPWPINPRVIAPAPAAPDRSAAPRREVPATGEEGTGQVDTGRIR